MKKFVSVLLVLIMALSAFPVLADTAVEDALLKVKAKLSVPEELSEFSYSENKYDDVLRYDFTWHTEDYTKELYVSTDSRGRIVTYNYYEQMDYTGERTLIDYTLADARPLAEETVKTMFPEYFVEGADKLVLNEAKTTSSYSGRYKSFFFTFDREFVETKVESNRVNVRVRATKDKMYLQSVTASLDEDEAFIPVNPHALKLADTPEDYEEKFPITIYYATDYSEDEPKVKLFYSIDKGYVQSDTGEIITQEYFDRYAGITEDSAADMEMGTGGTFSKNEAMLSPKEQGEIEKMESLVKPEEVEKMLRGLALLKITDDMKFTESYTYGRDDNYFVSFSLVGEKRYMNVTYNGETGEVTNISSHFTKYDDSEKKISDSNSSAPEDEIKTFTKTLAGDKFDETKAEFNTQNERSTLTATRIVNDVPFPENSISVTYDMVNNVITRYSLYWDEDTTDFPNPDAAMGLDRAREIIFENDIDMVWVKQTEGYVGAITIPESVIINAITGEKPYRYDEEKTVYTDIENHWAKDAINVLFEHDIYLPGDTFKPNDAITQADMIYLFSACRESGIIPLSWTKERIAEYGFTNGYVEATEPDKLMTRREAFKAMVEILGHGSIAEFDIYKSSYSDMEENGSAEILKAMGVLTGDTARPDDFLTRAEAAVMVYRYLAKE
ncbi:MAG: S-layer homology domain-containing protein [Clostridia bacterium]|nr:S-layer homology domain-containing protein [Clostridia bacterium]